MRPSDITGNSYNCPRGHPAHLLALNNLGNALQTRYDHTGEMTDLENAIRYHKEQIEICPTNHPNLSATLSSLGNALKTHYNHTGHMTNLERSIEYHRKQLALCADGHTGRAIPLHTLGDGLHERFKQTGKMADLEEAIMLYTELLQLRPIGHPGRLAALNNIGSALYTRFQTKRDIDDLNECICHYREGLTLRDIDHPEQGVTLNNLGVALSSRFEQSRDNADLEECISCHRAATAHSSSPPSSRLGSSTNWIREARAHSASSLIAAYSSALTLLDQSILLSSNIQDRYTRLCYSRVDTKHIAIDAAAHAITIGELQTPLDDLGLVDKELADRFRTLSVTIEKSTLSYGPEEPESFERDDAVARYRERAEAWDKTVEEIRLLEGFESFLRETPFTTLKKAAAAGPVIFVNISQFRSDAIIVMEAGEPLSISLPEAVLPAIERLSQKLNETITDLPEVQVGNRILTGILRDIWNMIVKPIVHHLENTLRIPRNSRIWWIPTSIAWSLPLRASGPFTPGERNMPDRYTSSYAPSLSSLLRARTGYQVTNDSSGPRMLLVAQRAAEGEMQQLVSVDREVSLIQQLPTRISVVEGIGCTREAVLAGLKETCWAHFACHGKQHATEPFKPQFSLRGGDALLTLLDIIQNGLPYAELALLSACHSAEGDKANPDEIIHLAAGVLFAGFRSVAGTMWAMADEDRPVIAEAFYKYMFRNGPGAVDCRDAAAKALAMGVKELRRRKVPFDRWINFVHYGI
ncbi:hypothetical protein FRB97_005239 [Tulasnella sp. 331]|nr:hypothetical protein FRB97_005239 [Tulasnella sp. 331]